MPKEEKSLKEPSRTVDRILEEISAHETAIAAARVELEQAQAYLREYPRRYEFVTTHSKRYTGDGYPAIETSQKDCPRCLGHGILDEGTIAPVFVHCDECWTDRVRKGVFYCRCGGHHKKGPVAPGSDQYCCLSCGAIRTPKKEIQ